MKRLLAIGLVVLATSLVGCVPIQPVAVSAAALNTQTNEEPVSPGNDPSCDDATMQGGFADAMARHMPNVGISYMLSGGSDESNFDPTATGPAPGDDWVTTPAHVMMMAPGGFDKADFTTDYASGYPYIMFDDTDVEHLMIPVADRPALDGESE